MTVLSLDAAPRHLVYSALKMTLSSLVDRGGRQRAPSRPALGGMSLQSPAYAKINSLILAIGILRNVPGAERPIEGK